ncbi:MAG TPA: hypothetical protein VK081_06645 [Planctomycetota bacterium]|nr:hypothetical protein [Planctomycetota bacterium]
MKKVLMLACSSIVLFVATIVGLLALQGRLDYEGTRGIPVLSAFFAPPPTPEPAPSPAKDRTSRPAADPGLGREKPLPYRQGTPLFAGDGGAAPAANREGASGEPEGGSAEAAARAPADAGASPAPNGEVAPAPLADAEGAEWRAKVDSVMGQGQYRPGRLWSFPQIEAGIGVDELNDILRRAREERAAVERERSALERQRTELAARERDVADRQDAVLEKLREVEQLRAKLQAEIDEFHATVLLIRQDETAGLQAVAKTLGAVEARNAAAVFKKWWETEEGQTRALKIWTVMDADAANAILGELDVETIRQVLEKRLKVARQQARAARQK